MDLFRTQSVRFGTTIHTETISRVGACLDVIDRASSAACAVTRAAVQSASASAHTRPDLSARPFHFWREGAEDGEPESADTIIIATGASARRMNLPGEDTYWQSGISACAVCDGAVPIFRNKPLAVIGGGDSACEEATYLTKYASHVYVLVRKDALRASKVMAKRLTSHPKVRRFAASSSSLTAAVHRALQHDRDRGQG